MKFFVFSLLNVGMALCGCSFLPPKNVSGNPKYPTDYVVNQIYQAKVPFFLETTGFFLPLGANGVPISVEEYNLKGKTEWPHVLGMVDPGSKLRIISIKLEKSFDAGNMVWVHAEVMTGPLAGSGGELSFISKGGHQKKANASIPMVDPKYLELIGP
jgi:hypothetical protein